MRYRVIYSFLCFFLLLFFACCGIHGKNSLNFVNDNMNKFNKSVERFEREYNKISDNEIKLKILYYSNNYPKINHYYNIVRMCSLIKIVGSRPIIVAKKNLEEIMLKVSSSNIQNQIRDGRIDYRIYIEKYAEISILQIEMVDLKIESNVETFNFLINRIQKKVHGIMTGNVDAEMAIIGSIGKHIIPNLIEALNESEDDLQPFILDVLETQINPDIQHHVILFMEKELMERNYDNYYCGLGFLERVGDIRAVKYLIEKSDKNISSSLKISILESLFIMHKRDVITKEKFLVFLEKLIKTESSMDVKNKAKEYRR